MHTRQLGGRVVVVHARSWGRAHKTAGRLGRAREGEAVGLCRHAGEVAGLCR